MVSVVSYKTHFTICHQRVSTFPANTRFEVPILQHLSCSLSLSSDDSEVALNLIAVGRGSCTASHDCEHSLVA
jgi:hypothetical protein